MDDGWGYGKVFEMRASYKGLVGRFRNGKVLYPSPTMWLI